MTQTWKTWPENWQVQSLYLYVHFLNASWWKEKEVCFTFIFFLIIAHSQLKNLVIFLLTDWTYIQHHNLVSNQTSFQLSLKSKRPHFLMVCNNAHYSIIGVLMAQKESCAIASLSFKKTMTSQRISLKVTFCSRQTKFLFKRSTFFRMDSVEERNPCHPVIKKFHRSKWSDILTHRKWWLVYFFSIFSAKVRKTEINVLT